MSRPASALMTILALAASLPAARGQALPMDEYLDRRQHLEWAYANAETDEEKFEIYEEFRQLELAQTAPAPKPPAEQPEAKKPAAGGQGAKGSSGVTDEDVDAVIAGLLDTLGAIGDGLGTILDGTGLGSGGDEKVDVDPRLLELVERSNRERSLSGSLKSLGWDETDDMAGYDMLHDEVGAWLDEAAKPGRSWSDAELVSWASALNNLGNIRSDIAGHRASGFWQAARDAEASRLAGLERSLSKKNQSLGKIIQALQNAQNMQEGVADALSLKDKLSTLESAVGLVFEPGAIEAVGAAVSEIFNQVDSTGDAVNAHVAKLAAYVTKQAAQLEGYESMQALLDDIATTVALIQGSAHNLEKDVKMYGLAVQLEGEPVYLKSW